MPTHSHLTLVLPALLWPHQQTSLPTLSLPGLNALRSQGKYTAHSFTRSSLYQQFLWHGSWIAQAQQQLALEPSTAMLMAIPINQNTGMHQVQCSYGHTLAITPEEAQTFCQSLNQWFKDDDWYFTPVKPDIWLVQPPRQLDFTQPNLLDLAGTITIADKPQGTDATELLKKQTELQMFLYQHPLNQQRIAQGLPAINDVWLQQNSIGQQVTTTTLYTDSSWAWQAETVPGSWQELQQHQPNGDMIVCLSDLCTFSDAGDVFGYADTLHQWDQLWWQPLWHSVQKHELRSLSIICDGEHGGSLRITPPSIFSWLRRAKSPFNGSTL